jgi:cell division septation protein DedD
MPRLNLKDDSLEGESGPLDSDKDIPAPPTLRDVGGGGGRSSPLLLIVLIVVAIGVGVFALNYFKVIHLWGKKVVKVAEVLPEAAPSTEAEPSTDMGAAPGSETASPATEPLPEPSVAPPTASGPASSSAPSQKAPKVMPPPAGSGSYTLQVSSWTSKAKADEEASKLSAAGYSAFVEDAVVGGENWYRVRVGRYGSTKEAEEAAVGIQKMAESVIWIAKVGGK